MKRRVFTKEFKLEVLQELDSGKTTAQVCREHGLHATMLYRWKKEYEKNPGEAFSGHGNLWKEEAKLAEKDRLIGKLYAENEFLKKAIANLQQQRAEEKEFDFIVIPPTHLLPHKSREAGAP